MVFILQLSNLDWQSVITLYATNKGLSIFIASVVWAWQCFKIHNRYAEQERFLVWKANKYIYQKIKDQDSR